MIDTNSKIPSADIGRKDLVPGLRAFLKEHGLRSRTPPASSAGRNGRSVRSSSAVMSPTTLCRRVSARARSGCFSHSCVRVLNTTRSLARPPDASDWILWSRALRISSRFTTALQALAEALSCGDHAAYDLLA